MNVKRLYFLVLICVSGAAFSAEESPVGKITSYFTGWNSEQVKVTIAGATYIEGDCPTKDGYMTTESDNSGFKSHTSALLAAYMSGKSVKLIIDGCGPAGRPKIIGVHIFD